jgi:hypothetical protein
MEQQAYKRQMEYTSYIHSSYGRPTVSYLPADGLAPARMSNTELANNSCDIESFLFGIGSSNLVNPQTPVVPSLKTLPSLSIIERLPKLMPNPLVIEPNQRPTY